MKKKRILLIGGNYFPEPTGIGKYSGEMMDWFAAHGFECGVVTTYPYYPYWKVQKPYDRKSSWFKRELRQLPDCEPIVIHRCPHFVPAVPTGLKRIISDFSLFISAFTQVFCLLFRKKYDFVITVAPPFQLGLVGYMYKKIKGAKLIYHIQDLQIDAAQELEMIKSKALLRIMFAIERFILRKASFITSISEGMIKKIKAKTKKDVFFFPNWADTEFFSPMQNNIAVRIKYGFTINDKIVLYSGAIGEKQGLESLLEIAKELKSKREIKFIICGSGPYKSRLIKLADDMKLNNVFFMPLQPREEFNSFLNMADLHLILQKANANDLVLPSKLTTILSVGGVVLVTSPEGSSLYNLITDHKMGLICEPENQELLANAIKSAVENPFVHASTKKNARIFAEEFLTIDRVIGRFVKQFLTKEAEVPVEEIKEETVQEEVYRTDYIKKTEPEETIILKPKINLFTGPSPNELA